MSLKREFGREGGMCGEPKAIKIARSANNDKPTEKDEILTENKP
jgi:hypothetical protein